MTNLTDTFRQARAASKELALLPDRRVNEILQAVADAIEERIPWLLEANAQDLALMDEANPLHDRLKLTPERLAGIAADMRAVSRLPSPLGRTLAEKTLPNGLRLRKVSVPFGVIGMVYEARPNVTFDVFSLCLKSGNACVLKGGKDADRSNRAAVELIHETLDRFGVSPRAVTLLPATHEATARMLTAVGYIDLCIPRGSKRLIDFVRETAKVPVIETGAGVVHAYFDEDGDLEMGKAIINNAKTRRPSVCNALDCLLVHRSRLPQLAQLCEPLTSHQVRLYADPEAFEALRGRYPEGLLFRADGDTWGREWLDYAMGVKTVADMDEAIRHIEAYGSGHSECAITSSKERAARFQALVDAACVYVNAPTSFTDGAQFGLGAEIGISTQKLGARGPMALEEITTYKWLINGEGQTRP